MNYLSKAEWATFLLAGLLVLAWVAWLLLQPLIF